jgi:transposase
VDELRKRVRCMEPGLLPEEAREAVVILFEQLDGLSERIDRIDARILAWHISSEASRRRASAPGVGPITATAIVAAWATASSSRRRGTSRVSVPGGGGDSAGAAGVNRSGAREVAIGPVECNFTSSRERTR